MNTLNQALKMPLSREVCPPNFRQWVNEDDKQVQVLEAAHQQWLNNLKSLEDAFKRFVYENAKLSNIDLRQHRKWLCIMISEGEELALAFNLNNHGNRKKFTSAIDVKVTALLDVLFKWHAPPEGHRDIPQSFKEAMAEAAKGNFSERQL